jgi:hypothetical protein
MRLSQNPLFRKEITPWYDSEVACSIVLLVMLLVVVFSLVGLSVARENPEFNQHAWVPFLLLVLSLAVIISTVVRLIQRHSHRYTEPY